jgi:PAS domain S-box-containing protein
MSDASTLVMSEYGLRLLALAGALLCVVVIALASGIYAAVMARRVREKNEQLGSALNNMNHGLMMFDRTSRVILCNKRYLELYRLAADAITPGLTLREVIERRVAAGTFDGDPEAYCAGVLRAVQRGETSRNITMTPHGRLVEVLGQPLANGGWVATHQDVTEERARQASFRFLFDDNPLPMWVWDHATLRFLAVNNAALEKYGYSREHFLTLTLRDTKRSEDWNAISGVVSGDERKLREGIVSRHAKADGSLFDVELYGRSMTYEGRAASLVAALDITERKRAEGELHRTQHFLDTIIENMPAMLLVKDARTMRYVLANRAAEEVYGIRSEDVIGKTAEEVFPRQSGPCSRTARCW